MSWRITDFTYTHFQPTSADRLHFAITWPSADEPRMPGWERQALGSTRHIPGTNRNITYLTGLGPRSATYDVWLESVEAYAALEAAQQLEGVLQLPRRVAGIRGTDIVEPSGVVYTRISGVLLMNVTAPLTILGDNAARQGSESVECTVTFQKNEDDA